MPMLGTRGAASARGFGFGAQVSPFWYGAAGASTLGNALIGGAAGALSGGGVKSALTGAVTGGLAPNISDIVGNLPGALQGATQSGAPLEGLSKGSGLAGVLGRTTGLTSEGLGSVIGAVGSGAGGGSTFSRGNMLSTALGGFQQDAALKKQREQLAAANQQQLGNLENLSPQDVQNDVGYQFAQQQGEQALARSLGAQGGLFSGRALQEASRMNQDLASRFYGDAYGRQAGKVGAQNAIYGNTGINNAAITGARADNISSSLAKALGGNQGMTLEEMRRLGLI
jgi:hypothetical protein